MADITEGLVGHWRLTDGSGDLALDSSGAGNDGVIEGAPSWASDPVRGGTVLVFDGIDDRINFGPLFTFQNSSWSVSLWFKTPPSDDRIPLWGKNDASGGFNIGERDIEITGNGTWGNIITPEPAGNLAVNAHSQGGAVTNQDVISLDDDTWHLGTVVHDDSAGATDITFYIDGVAQVAGSQTFNNNSQPDVGDVYLGFANASGSGAEGYFFGRMSDLRLYERALSPDEVVQIMEASLNLETAGDAFPADEATDVLRNVTLSWSAGKFAQTHNVYFGTSYAYVDNAGIGDSVSQNQTASSYNAGVLNFGQTYYWRVDEVNAAPDNTVFKGNVWSFTVEPFSIPVETVFATASSANDNTMGPENTVNGSGLNDLDQHSTDAMDMWLSAPGDQDVWIQYEFDQAYKLDKLLVWNSNQLIEAFIGLGAKEVTIESSIDGETWMILPDILPFNQAGGSLTYTANTTVDFDGVLAKYVRINVDSGYGPLGQFGLSELRFFYIPTFARTPMPADQAVTEGVDVELTWRAGREAVAHQVYVGTDADDLSLIDTTATNSYTLSGLDYNTSYVWQIIEVNEQAVPASHASEVWRFSTPAYRIVDDFEGYDDDCARVFFSWEDGLGHNGGQDLEDCEEPASNGNGSGSIVGNASAPFAETNIVNSGSQSMPLEYQGLSETTLSLEGAQDWSASGIKSLAIALRGAVGNTGQLYVKINNTKLVYDGSIAQPSWQTWNIDLSEVGTNLANVSSITLGVDGAAAGMLYIDDIRLHPSRCVPEFGPIGDINGDCRVDDADVAALMNDWLVNYTAVDYSFDTGLEDASGNANNGIALDNPVVAGGVLSLDGTSVVDIPLGADNPFDGSQDFSIAMDFKAAAPSILISSSLDDTPGNHAMAVYINTNGTVVYDNFYVGAASAGVDTLDNEWHTLVVSYDAEGPAVQVFLDGAPGSIGDFNPAIPDIASNTVRIGSSLNKTFPYSAGVVDLNGSVDNLRIFNFTLDAHDVIQLPTLPQGPADLNGDGIVDQTDKDLVEAEIGTEQYWPL